METAGVASILAAVLGLLASSAPAIPYATNPASAFASNPLAADVTLPPLPDALKPMGPPKPAPLSIVSPLPPATGPKSGPGAGPTTTGLPADTAGSTTVNGMEVGDESPAHHASKDDTTITTSNSSGFLDWVRQNQDAAALARSARARYNQAPPSPAETGSPEDDLMLNIRYPYLWNQDQPPSGSSVIYTIKK